MPSLGYATEVGFERERSIAGGIVGLFFALGFGLAAHGMIVELLGDLLYLDHRAEDMRRAHWAWMTCNIALATLLSATAVSIVARSLRGALGLPPLTRSRANMILWPLRIAGVCVLWIVLWSRGLSEYAFLDGQSSPLAVFGLGLAMCTLFSFDVPQLFANAIAALRARAPMLRARFATLDELPRVGRVHVHGRLVAPYALGTRADVRVAGRGGEQVLIELDPEHLVLVGELGEADVPLASRGPIPAGTEVRVIGEAVGHSDAYRSEVRIRAGQGAAQPLHLYVGAATSTRRLLLAATVELFASVGLAGCVLGMTGFFCYLWLRVAMH